MGGNVGANVATNAVSKVAATNNKKSGAKTDRNPVGWRRAVGNLGLPLQRELVQ